MKFKEIFIITRSWSLPITFISVTAGSMLAYLDNKFSFWLYLTCLLGASFFHAGANTLNDYLDLRNKIDTPESPTALYRLHPVFTNILTPKQLIILSSVLLVWGSIIGIYLALSRTSLIWLLLFPGIVLAVFYSFGSKGLKYIALGEPTVFLAFGPLMVEGAYVVQASRLLWRVFLISIPIGLLIALVLLANNLRDMDFDAKCKIKTICVLLGESKSLWFFMILSLAPFGLILVYILFGILSWPALLVFFALPFALKLNREFCQKIPVSADAKTSQLSLSFGLLLILALLLEKKFI